MAFSGIPGTGLGATSTAPVGLPLFSATNPLGQSTGMGPGLSLGLGPLGQGQDWTVTNLSQETELQKMLADERMRGEMHKTNYQMLKAEHTK